MDRSEFDEFKNYILRANRNNSRVIEIFHKLSLLLNGVKDELILLKPKVGEYNYNAHIESLEHEIYKLGYGNADYSKINHLLDKHKPSEKKFLKWNDIIPSENILYDLLNTDLNMFANIVAPKETNYKSLGNYSYADIQKIQLDFEVFIKSFCINELHKFLKTQKNRPLIEKTNNSEDNLTEEIKLNPHLRIFISLNAFLLFESFTETIESKNKLADYSFIYRIMQEDGLIYEYVGDSEYRTWLGKHFDIIIGKTKQLYRCSTSTKKNLYYSLKSNFKPY